MRYTSIFAKSFHLCLLNDKICTKYAVICIKSCYIMVEFQELIYRIGFTVVKIMSIVVPKSWSAFLPKKGTS